MKAYFDSKVDGNLIYDVSDKGFAPLNKWTHYFTTNAHVFLNAGFTPIYDKNITEPTIYYIALRHHADFWSGLAKKEAGGPIQKHLLEYIDKEILDLVRQRKMIIVLDNQAEGNSLHRNGFDAYRKFHYTMNLLGLPDYSILFVDSNKNFITDYENWCVVNRTSPKIAHAYALTGFYYFDRHDKIPNTALILDAIQNENSVDFNSLNRTARIHRLDHLYYLIKRGLHKNNLVSGNAVNRAPGILLDKQTESPMHSISSNEFVNTLNENLPISVDGIWATDNPDKSVDAIFNHMIYKNSLLSFVTETEFSDTGLFITEKVFKPIVAGHPFIVLGQPGVLDYIRELGYKVDFCNIDTSYDKIKNPRERFFKVHDELLKWIHTPRQEKIYQLEKSIDMIEHNLQVFKTKQYVTDSYINIRKVAEDIFSNNYRVFGRY